MPCCSICSPMPLPIAGPAISGLSFMSVATPLLLFEFFDPVALVGFYLAR
jgi:hypothetical protein